ncbi:DUF1659 domain-containing protein [Bacillus sp. BRMEA1]|uniref:DUF1659 domain-containing protein n=1 Tax=Neobacillus endophyticus TaxID=2738405 RepID=UPI001563EF3E|nr:DUF1659 domain-containing protein [Neobacillus endophyticus]NRD76922.1 DUF1659 domain-containing protein [Neobacillus endophyticus]
MARSLLQGTKLRLVFDGGMDEKGKPILKTKSFSNVKKEASTDQLFQAASAIATLCTETLNKVERTDSSEILA